MNKQKRLCKPIIGCKIYCCISEISSNYVNYDEDYDDEDGFTQNFLFNEMMMNFMFFMFF